MPSIRPELKPSIVTADPPFDSRHLDKLMDRFGIDILLVTSKHNIQYLLGGYRYFFFGNFDALGVSRYLPILIYPKGRPERTTYIGNAMEDSEAEIGRFWCPTVETTCWGTLDAANAAIEHVRRLGTPGATIGIEFSFFPTDASDVLRAAFADWLIVDAHLPLERLRAIKTSDELTLIQEAFERVVEAMIATFAQIRLGMTKRELAAKLRQEELDRGLNFDYCLITAGTGFNRSPSPSYSAR